MARVRDHGEREPKTGEVQQRVLSPRHDPDTPTSPQAIPPPLPDEAR